MLVVVLTLFGVCPFLGLVESQQASSVFVSNLGQNSINPLGSNLYNGICAGETNCVYSPYSLFVVLSMLVDGANGETQEQLNQVLGDYQPGLISELIKILNTEDIGYILNSVNAIYTDQKFPINDDYRNSVQEVFKANAGSLDFQSQPEESRLQINTDISKATQGEITELLPVGSISSNTVMVLTNALYFKASWLVKFDADKTDDKDFFVEPSQPIQVQTMSVSGRFRTTILSDGTTLVELPYSLGYRERKDLSEPDPVNWDMSMVIVLPAKGQNIDSINRENYISEGVKMMSTTEKVAKEQVNIQIPKFEIEFDAGSLKNDLQDLGLESVFSSSTADFSGIANSEVYISDVFHKAKVQIDEDGTVAAAASTIILDFDIFYFEVDIIIDRPFGFMIIYQPAVAVLFLGKVGNPSI